MATCPNHKRGFTLVEAIIFDEVDVVVVIDEIISADGAIDSPAQRGERDSGGEVFHTPSLPDGLARSRWRSEMRSMARIRTKTS